MKRWLLIGVPAVVLIGLPLLFAVAIKRVQPDRIGVKQIRWGGGGFVPRDYEVGFHWGISGYHLWHFLPKETHILHFNEEGAESRDVMRWKPALEIRTKDNNTVTVEASVLFRIKPGEGHRILEKGIKQDYFDRANSTIESVVRTGLAELGSEDLQDSDKRIERTAALLPVLNQQLAVFHVEAESILIRRFTFLPEYEEQLQEKQYLRQKANLDEALTAKANEERLVNAIERQIVAAELASKQGWEKKLQEQRSDYLVRIAGIEAEAAVYAARTQAEGEARKTILEAEGKLAQEQVEALRNRLRTEALNSEGGSILLALEAASNLDIPAVTLNSDDPDVPLLFDLQAMTKLLLGEGRE